MIKKEIKKNLINLELEKQIKMLKEIYDYQDQDLINVATNNIEPAYGLLKKEQGDERTIKDFLRKKRYIRVVK
ncbi:MAG: hypothetical protein M1276_03980 [Deltaproteobacteria bacterium]|jgi:hypothetical protein|nr:hypothetical protein [Deltaproteobacteria bacterium]